MFANLPSESAIVVNSASYLIYEGKTTYKIVKERKYGR
jgi:hypothetical protein